MHALIACDMFSSFSSPINACVFGASGGIGSAILAQLAVDPMVTRVYAGSRKGESHSAAKVIPFRCDITDEEEIAAAAAAIDDDLGDRGSGDQALQLVFIATGLLHDSAAGLSPEKSYRSQSGDAYASAFAVNATGPALIGKHFLPLMARKERCIFAALSARVGSISDNRLGGWHAYRASKAALNMILQNFALEIGLRNSEALVVGLHPGTVDTRLSQPFQRNVSEGKLFSADYSAGCMLNLLDSLTPEDSGQLFAWNGVAIPY